ncbi:MAG: ABC transporter substrate-binding protein [Treponemataceae bacterium]
MKFFRRMFLGALLVMAMCFTVTSCAEKPEKDSDEVVYTYREAWTTGPLNWNPHTWENSGDSSMLSFITTSLVYPDMTDTPGEWDWCFEAATAVTDITADFAEKEKYGISEDTTEGRVYQIDLDPDMKWDTGEAITADDYEYSMKVLLDPHMKNYRASYWVDAEAALYNADKYFKNDKAGKDIYAAYEPGKDVPAGAELVFSFEETCYFFGEPAKNYYKKAQERFMSGDVDIFKKYEGQDTFPVTEEAKADLLVIAAAFGDTGPEAWKEFQVYKTGEVYKETPWEDVGFKKTGEYQIVFILAKPLSNFDALTLFGSSPLVHKETYEANFKTVEGLKATSYGTDVATTRSYGPYKLETFEKDKQMRFVRNPHWGGYKNPANKGKYVPDAIIVDIIEDHATKLQRFGQGLIDIAGLTSDDVEKYKKSDRIVYTEESYTDRLVFGTSKRTLEARDKEKGSGKRIVLHYKDFRKALSLSIDREKYCREATAGFKPAMFLLNGFYYYDIGNDPNSIYRNSFYAKKAILDLYGIDATPADVDEKYEKLTGRDVGLAQELFTKAYKQAVADGVYSDGEEVPIEVMVSPSDLQPSHIKQQDLLQEFIDEGSKGTPFEGKIKIKFLSGDPKRYESVVNGKQMAIKGAWGGAYFYPFRMIGCYVSPEHMGGLDRIHESNGWNPSKENRTLNIKKVDGSTYTDTRALNEWWAAINGGGDFFAAPGVEKLQILAALENATLSSYQCIPLGTHTVAELVSYKIDYGADEYHVMYGRGGLKHFKFNYTDAEWDKFVKENKGQLNYE